MPRLTLEAQLGLNKIGFDAGISAAEKQVEHFGKHLAGHIGALVSAGAFVHLAEQTIEYGHELENLSDRLGITTEEAQRFSLAARLGGAETDFFATRFEKLRKAISAGKENGKNPLASFGFEAENASEAIEILSNHIQKFGVNTEQANALVDIFGKGGGRMINVLKQLPNATSGVLGFKEEDIENMARANSIMVKFGENAKIVLAGAIGAFTTFSGALRAALLAVPGGRLLGEKLLPSHHSDRIKVDESNADATYEEKIAAQAHMATMDRINAMEKQAAEINEKSRVERLTDEEKLNELIKYRTTLIENLSTEEVDADGIFTEGAVMMQLALAKTNASIEEMGRSIFNAHQKSKSGLIGESALGKIGAFTGASAQAGLSNTQAAQLQRLTMIHDALIYKGIIVKDAK